MRSFSFYLLLSLVIFYMNSCGPKEAKRSPVVKDQVAGCCGPKEAMRTPIVQNEVVGSSSGGGSFGDESSLNLLYLARAALAKNLAFFHRGTFLKENQLQYILDALNDLDLQPNRSTARYGRELMFDYSDKSENSRVIVNQLFFRAHAAVPVNSLSKERLSPYIQEIQLKLLHETAHLLGIGRSEDTDHKAREFAQSILHRIETNNFVCRLETEGAEEKDFLYKQLTAKTRMAFNRASGEGVLFVNEQPNQIESKLWAGEPVKASSIVPDYEIRESYNAPFPARPFNGYPVMDWIPDKMTDNQITYVYQDEIKNIDERLTLNRGAKKEWSMIYESRGPRAFRMDGKCIESSDSDSANDSF